jgi:hypothetical protein
MSRMLSAAGGGAAVALMIALGGVWITQQLPARAGGLDALAGAQGQAAVPVERDGFVKEVERRLKGCRERIAALGPSLLAEINDRSRAMNEAMNQSITVESAKANLGNATLTREVAEIAVTEYEVGIARQDEATIEGELKLAESELTRATNAVEVTKERLTKIKQASKGTAADVAVEYSYEDNVAEAERRQPKAKLAVEQAQSKLKMLRQYTKARCIKQLQSEVQNARADELAKKATWELEKSKLDRLHARVGNAAPKPSTGEPLAALTRAFSVEEKTRAEVVGLQKNGTLDAVRAKATRDLVSQLEGLVDQSEAEVATARVERLKAAINEAAVRFGAPKP